MPKITRTENQTTVQVELGDRSYDVIVGSALLGKMGAIVGGMSELSRRCAVVTEERVGALYGEWVVHSLQQAGIQAEIITVPPGESSKSMNVVTFICREMLKLGFDRKAFVVALGGGVIGDLAGFCASIFQRGVPYIQVPTTVLSQVDSSVGGKTGVNTPEGKNLLGAFHQPKLVVADVDTLKSLPDREYREGFAEIIKHAAIRDAEMFELIENQGDDRSEMAELIARNVALKAAVVEEDERETSGTRALLNFGHTVGHGVEAAAGYGELLHGEAISIGIMAALRLSEKRSGLKSADVERVANLLKQFGLPRNIPSNFQTQRIVDLMMRDKKFSEGAIRFVLLKELGSAFVSSEVTLEDIRAEIDRLIVV
ncbi:MAG: 3-dehydroquinate synthase [Verrucomicrobiota bacterium]